MEIREINHSLRGAIKDLRGEVMVSRGRVHLLEQLPGFIVLYDDEIKGLITYHIADDQCEIVSLDSKQEDRGIGTKLIDQVISKAREHDCKRVWLITSNDNSRAIRFYQKRGFDLKAVYHDAITEARKIKPTIPLIGYDGIPIRHEIEFAYLMQP